MERPPELPSPDEPLKLIVALGNPGREYADTRHNAGWWFADHLAGVWHFDTWRKDGQASRCDTRHSGHRVRLVKPQTYMNLSGAALKPYLRRKAWSPADDLLVVVDDVALPAGRFRLRSRGSAGGHNGLKSIEQAVGGQTYARLRLGVGPAADRRRQAPLADYVLDRMGKGERATVEARFPELTDLCETWIKDGVSAAMNRFNHQSAEEEPD